MLEKSISYPKVCKRYESLYYIDFNLNNKRIRMFSGKKIGLLTKLQKAMGHSSLNVCLTYLRGLEVTELKEEDMPMAYGF